MIETRVEGSTASVDSAAAWLRDSLRERVDEAGEKVLSARRTAERQWEGEAGAAYAEYAGDIVRVTDEHVDRISRAAEKLDAYSARLRQVQERMAALRREASAGGLPVLGTVIQEPAPAVPYLVPTGDLTPQQARQVETARAQHEAQVATVELYNRILTEVEDEWARFVAWVDAHLTPASEALEAPRVEQLVALLQENVGNLAISLALTQGERSLARKSRALLDEARDLRRARRSGNPARRALGNAPDTPGRIRSLTSHSDLLGRGGRLLGPAGAGLEVWNGLESDDPGGGLLAAGVGIGAGALIVATAPASVPTLLVVGAAVGVGFVATELTGEIWDQLPDGLTEPVDDWVGDRWDDTKDVASDGWDTVKGWF